MDKKTFFCAFAPKEYAAYEDTKKQASIAGKNMRAARLAWLAARDLAAPPHPLEGACVSYYGQFGKHVGYVFTYRLGDPLGWPEPKVLPGDAIVRIGPKEGRLWVYAYAPPWRPDAETEEKRAANMIEDTEI